MYNFTLVAQFTQVAWDQMIKYWDSYAQISQQAKRDHLFKYLGQAQTTIIDGNNNHLMIYTGLDTDIVGGNYFYNEITNELTYYLNQSMRKVISIDEQTGARRTFGTMADVFGIKYSTTVDYPSVTGVRHLDMSTLPIGFNKPGKTSSPTPMGPAINNHTCKQCGNTKCSKTEKSCWKCGAAISP